MLSREGRLSLSLPKLKILFETTRFIFNKWRLLLVNEQFLNFILSGGIESLHRLNLRQNIRHAFSCRNFLHLLLLEFVLAHL